VLRQNPGLHRVQGRVFVQVVASRPVLLSKLVHNPLISYRGKFLQSVNQQILIWSQGLAYSS